MQMQTQTQTQTQRLTQTNADSEIGTSARVQRETACAQKGVREREVAIERAHMRELVLARA